MVDPGIKVKWLMAVGAQPAPGALELPQPSPSAGLWSNAWYSLRRDRLTMAAGAVVLLIIGLSLGAPLLAEYVFKTTFDKQDLLHTYGKPALDPPAYLLGTDEVGRTHLVRLFYGGQGSFFGRFVAAFLP